MSKQSITIESFTKAIEAAVQERGADWTYPDSLKAAGSCMYFMGDGPACLIGLALSKLGYTHFDIEEETSAADVLMDLGCQDDELMNAAEAAQASQDQGKPWGEALSRYYRRLGVDG